MWQKRLICIWNVILLLQLSNAVSITKRAGAGAAQTNQQYQLPDQNTEEQEFFSADEVFGILNMDNLASEEASMEVTTLPTHVFRPLATTTARPLVVTTTSQQPSTISNNDNAVGCGEDYKQNPWLRMAIRRQAGLNCAGVSTSHDPTETTSTRQSDYGVNVGEYHKINPWLEMATRRQAVLDCARILTSHDPTDESLKLEVIEDHGEEVSIKLDERLCRVPKYILENYNYVANVRKQQKVFEQMMRQQQRNSNIPEIYRNNLGTPNPYQHMPSAHPYMGLNPNLHSMSRNTMNYPQPYQQMPSYSMQYQEQPNTMSWTGSTASLGLQQYQEALMHAANYNNLYQMAYQQQHMLANQRQCCGNF